MKQMIEKKNKMLREARDDMYEIYTLARVLRHADAPDELYRKLVQTVVDKIALASYDYNKYAIESELYLPEAEEADFFQSLPTDEEIKEAREVNGDD